MTILPSLILASASPRRANLLTQLGLEFRIEPSHMPEEVLPGERPEGHAERLSREKALEVWAGNRTSLVVAGDTVVVLDGEILGKPSDQEHAETMLLALSGRTHIVVSGLALAIPEGELYSGTESTEVTFRRFGPDEARAYAATGEPMDKAGAYGIQGLGSALVSGIRGDYHTVVGLPVPLLLQLLRRAGYWYEFGVLKPIPQEAAK